MFKLALALGRTVAELEHSLSATELIEWQAYERLDPFGGYRLDLQTAHLLYAKVGGDGAKLSDFLPVDPYPMTDEMRQQYDEYIQAKELEQQTQAMIQMFRGRDGVSD